MKKRTHKKLPTRVKSKKKSTQRAITLIAMIVVTIMLAAVIGAFFFIEENKTQTKNQIQLTDKNLYNTPTLTFEEKAKALEIEYDNSDSNIYIEQKPSKIEPPKFHYEEPDYGKDTGEEPLKYEEIIPEPTHIEQPPIEIQEVVPVSKKPKLAIIIDDVTTQFQINQILDLGYKVNMAFLPPTSGHPNSAKIVKNLQYYMIHLPLQASSFQYEEENTLHIGDSLEVIEKRIQQLKSFYPKAQYINNHTGSKFTANQEAMDKLFQVLKKHNLIFVDSRTTANSVAAISAKKFGVKMLSRNVFLDNHKDKKYIQSQLKKAVISAKKYGKAIAIGHPYKATFEALKDAKEILEDLELVYIHQL